MNPTCDDLRGFAEVEAYPALLALIGSPGRTTGRSEPAPNALFESVLVELDMPAEASFEIKLRRCLDLGELGAARYLLAAYAHDKKLDSEIARAAGQFKSELEMKSEVCQGQLLLMQSVPDPEFEEVRRAIDELLADRYLCEERPGVVLKLLEPQAERLRALISRATRRHREEFQVLSSAREPGANQDLDRALEKLEQALGAEDRLPTAQKLLDIAYRARQQDLAAADLELLHRHESTSARFVGDRRSVSENIRTAADALRALETGDPFVARLAELDSDGKLRDVLNRLSSVGSVKFDRVDAARKLAQVLGIEHTQPLKSGFCELKFSMPRIPALRATHKAFSGKIAIAVPGSLGDASVGTTLRGTTLPESALKVIYLHRRMEQSLRPILSTDQNVVFCDIADLLLVSSCEPSRRQVAFQQILLPRLPVQRIKPYQGGGPVEPEMFRGRRADMDRLRAPKGPTVLFSGRMMGKSSMLKKLDHDINAGPADSSAQGERAVFLSNAGSDLLPHLIRKLAEALGGTVGASFIAQEEKLASAHVGSTRANLEKRLQNLRKLIERLVQKFNRLVVFIDEADNFAKEDGQLPRNQSVAWTLRDLEFEWPEKLRFVFAGFQDIHRVVLYKNSAFANWFSLLRLEPLPQDEAKALVVEPFADCGFTFASPACVERILEFTGRHPLLIHEACWRLMERAAVRRALSRGVELVDITVGDVASVCREDQLRERLRQVLSLNLDEYPRLKLVVYLILFGSKEGLLGADVWREGFHLDDLRALLDAFFSDRLNEHFDERNLGALAYELEALGIIAKQGDRYVFANRAFGEMLLADRDFDEQLNSLLERVTRPAAMPPRRFATVAAFDFEKLVARHEGARLLVGLPGTSRSQVARKLFVTPDVEGANDGRGRSGEMLDRPAYLLSAAGCRTVGGVIDRFQSSVKDRAHASKQFGALLVKHGFGTVIIDDADDLAAAAQLPHLLHDLRSEGVRALIVGGAKVARSYVETLAALDVDVVPMRRLREVDLREWGRETTNGPILVLDAACARRLLHVTGGYAPLLEHYRALLADGADNGGEVIPEPQRIDSISKQVPGSEIERMLMSSLTPQEQLLLAELHGYARRNGCWTLSMDWVMAEVLEPLRQRDRGTQEWMDVLDVLVLLDLVGSQTSNGGREIELQEGGPVARLLGSAPSG